MQSRNTFSDTIAYIMSFFRSITQTNSILEDLNGPYHDKDEIYKKDIKTWSARDVGVWLDKIGYSDMKRKNTICVFTHVTRKIFG